jgi:glutaminyl-peptide cyclotransferase
MSITSDSRFLRSLAIAGVAALAAAGCDDTDAPTRAFDGSAALAYAGQQVAFGPRVPGTEGHARMAAWLDSLLRTRADSVVSQRWTHVTRGGDTLQLVNLFASFNPTAPTRILFLAHWDTRPRSDGPAAAPADSSKPVLGANDGASGVAVLLGIADALDSVPPSIGVDLLFVDGEDYGDFFAEGRPDVLIGSRYYAAHQLAPAPLYAVLFDMVGDRDLRISREGNSVIGAPEVVDLVWKVAAEAGHSTVFVPFEGTTATDDHIELQRVGIRAIDLIDFSYGPGNGWWHSPEDTMDKISAESLGIVGEVALRLVQEAEK